jgi:hypothetical protein
MNSIEKYLSLMSRLRVAEHLGFYYMIVDTIKDDVEHIALLQPAWRGFRILLDKESEIFKWPRRSEYGTAILNGDRKRVDGFLAVKQQIRAACHSLDPAIRSEGEALAWLIDPYKELYRLPLVERSAQLDILLCKLAEAPAASINALHLQPAIDALAEQNQAFRRIEELRSEGRYRKYTMGTIRTVRPRVDHAFADFTMKLDILCRAAFIEGDKATGEQMEKIIRRINGFIDDYKNILAHHHSAGTSPDATDATGGTNGTNGTNFPEKNNGDD